MTHRREPLSENAIPKNITANRHIDCTSYCFSVHTPSSGATCNLPNFRNANDIQLDLPKQQIIPTAAK